MGCWQVLLLTAALLALTTDLSSGAYLSNAAISRITRALNSRGGHRVRRQLLTDPQPFNPLLPNKVLNVPLPTNIGHFPGGGQPQDLCDRDSILMEDGTCQSILTGGNCGPQEEVIVDPETNKGFCAPRLCPPDRVFVPSTQLCHDPQDTTVCPPGRELYYSAFGTAVCTCPDGTIEGDQDLDDDVCELVLGQSLQCQPGQDSDSDETSSDSQTTENSTQVFWFKDFQSPPECLPDPCGGANLNRGPDTLPFVPSKTGECFQLGQSQGVCPNETFYTLSLEELIGECSSLEDAGYNIFDPEEVQALTDIFGSPITGNNAPPIIQLEDQSTMRQNVTGTFQVPVSHPMIKNGNFANSGSQTGSNIIPNNNFGTEVQTGFNGGTSQITSIQGNLGPGGQSNTNIFPGTVNHNTNQGNQPFGNGQSIGNQQQVNQVSNVQSQSLNQAQPIIQGSFNPQNIHTSINEQNINPVNQQSNQNSFIQPNIQNSVNQQSNQRPFIQQNSQTPINQQKNQRPFIQSSNANPFNQQPNQGPFNQGSLNQNNQTPNNQQNILDQQNNLAPVNQQHNNLVNNRPSQGFGGQQNQVSSTLGQGNITGPKKICTFVQSEALGHFGNPGKKICTVIDTNPNSDNQGTQFTSQEITSQFSPNSLEILSGPSINSYGYRYGRSLGFKNPPQQAVLTNHFTILHDGNKIQHHISPRFKRQLSELPEKFITDLEHSTLLDDGHSTAILSRRKRNVLSYASPSNVFETRLLGCRPGAVRDINAKCRNTILPARIPKRRGTRAAPPVPPTPSCPNGMAFNIRRQCVPATTAQNSLIAYNLG